MLLSNSEGRTYETDRLLVGCSCGAGRRVVTSMAPASGQSDGEVAPIFGVIIRSSIHSDFRRATPEETCMLHATARVLKYCGALGTCAALAVCTAYVTSAAQSVREGQPQAGAVAKSRDDLASKLGRREVQRSPSSIPGREIVQVETLIPPGVESGWHAHPGEEVGYIIAGQVEMMVQGRVTVVLHAGDRFLIPRGPLIMRATSARKPGGCCPPISSRQASRSRRSWTNPFRGRAFTQDPAYISYIRKDATRGRTPHP